jgi:hypothetical protein
MGQPRTAINPHSIKNSLYVFEITSSSRQKKALFAAKNSPGLPATIAFKFKAFNEADLLSWIAELQKQIERLIPEGPPQPLFRPAQDVQDDMELVFKNPYLDKWQQGSNVSAPRLDGSKAEPGQYSGFDPNKLLQLDLPKAEPAVQRPVSRYSAYFNDWSSPKNPKVESKDSIDTQVYTTGEENEVWT